MSNNMFDRKDITAAEARELVEKEIDWDDFINSKIKQCNEQICEYAKQGYCVTRVEFWSREQYVWDKVMKHFRDNGFEVSREWRAIIIKW